MHAVEELNRQANEVAKTIGKAKDAAEREALKEEGRKLREQKDAAAGRTSMRSKPKFDAIQLTIPNLTHPAGPVGGDDKANLEVRRGQHRTAEVRFQAARPRRARREAAT